MRIIAISDLHGYFTTQPLPDGDVLVIAGDILVDAPVMGQAQWAKQELKPWLETLEKQFPKIILTWGNHDFVDAYGEKVSYALEGDRTQIVAEPAAFEHQGVVFFVSPYCKAIKGWAYQLEEIWLKEHYKWIPMGTDVIVSHGPPLDMCDKTCNMYGGSHAGSWELKKAVNKIQPKALICGHIHEAFGKYTKSHHGSSVPTVVYNVAQRNENYKYHHRPVVIDI